MRILIVIYLFCSNLGQSQSVESIVENYFSSIGGKEKIESIQAYRALSLTAYKDDYRGEKLTKDDSSRFMKISTTERYPSLSVMSLMDMNGKILSKFYFNDRQNGQILYNQDGSESVVRSENKRPPLRSFIAKNILDSYRDGLLKFKGVKEKNGVSYYVLSERPKNTKEIKSAYLYYFNKDTYLLEYCTEGSGQSIVTKYSDYYAIDSGVKVPQVIEFFNLSTYTFTKLLSFEVNPSIEDSFFYLPNR